MSIPEVRSRLHALAEAHNLPELGELAMALYRKSPVRRVAIRSQPATADLAKAIRAYAAAFPDAAQTEIAAVFKVNPGRVSEAMNGDR